jgi:hypothetical protein
MAVFDDPFDALPMVFDRDDLLPSEKLVLLYIVLGATTAHPRAAHEIGARTGLSYASVDRSLESLHNLGIIAFDDFREAHIIDPRSEEPNVLPERRHSQESKQPDRKGCVYLIRSLGKYKIGRSIDPKQRLSNLQSSSPHEMEMVAFGEFEDMANVEMSLHKEYQNHRVLGEWFDLPDECVGALSAYLTTSGQSET